MAILVAGASMAGRPETLVVRVAGGEALEQAIARAEPGQMLLLEPGTYPGALYVPPSVHDIVIRGTDRNDVVFDGEDSRGNGVEIEGDRVTIENLTIHNFTGNGIYWESVDGYAARYITVYNVGLYGIYAVDSRDGLIEHSFVSGAADSAFYVGECRPCDATLRDLTARLSAIGYSGTNASNVVVKTSRWINNGTGIMPNSYNIERYPPQGHTIFTGNHVRGSGRVPTPSQGPLGGFEGIGIAVSGGVNNEITDNEISGSARYGIALYPSLQRRSDPPWVPAGNHVIGNHVSGSGIADLAVADGSGTGNCFMRNEWASSLPRRIQKVLTCTGGDEAPAIGSTVVASDLAISIPDALQRAGPRPSYKTMPAPRAQQDMPGAATLPEDERAGGGTPWAAVVMAVMGGALLLPLLWRRSRSRKP